MLTDGWNQLIKGAEQQLRDQGVLLQNLVPYQALGARLNLLAVGPNRHVCPIEVCIRSLSPLPCFELPPSLHRAAVVALVSSRCRVLLDLVGMFFPMSADRLRVAAHRLRGPPRVGRVHASLCACAHPWATKRLSMRVCSAPSSLLPREI
jgi:hypothetical protein